MAPEERRVAVVIPCFNDGATLPTTVASVREQERCEVVVVDDGSNDPETIEVLRELERAGTTVLRQRNQGPSVARRAGLAATSARYVFALDADDLVAPGALTRLADALDGDLEAAVAWGDVETFGEVTVRQRGPRSLDPWLMTYLDELTGASTLVRRTRLAEAGWQLTEGFENWDMWLSFCERGWGGVYVPGVVLRYRLHGDGSRRSAKAQQEYAYWYATLQARHPRLFAERRALWRHSAAPLRLKLALPLIARLPLDPALKQRLGNVVNHPLRPLAVRRSRLRRALRGRVVMLPGDGSRSRVSAARPVGSLAGRTPGPTAAPVAAADAEDQAPRPVPRRSESSAAFLTFATNIGGAAVSLVSVLIVSRALGPSGRGAVALLTTIAIVTQYAATLGVQEANVNFGSADPATRSTLATNSVVLALLFGGAAAGALGAIATVFPGIAGHARPALLWLALGSVPVQLVGTYLYRLVQADYRFGISNLAWILAPVVNMSANATLYAFGVLSVRSALVSWVAGQTVESVLLLWATQRMCGFARPSLRLARQTVGFGVKIYPATVMNFANYRLDGWLLGVLAGRRELGLYSIAVAWAEALFFLPTAVGYAQRPHLVRGSSEDANSRAASGFRIAVLLTVPLTLGMVLAAPILCVTVFGARFYGSIIDLRILALGAFGILALKLLGNALTARGKPLRQTAATAVAFVCTVALDILLIPRYGGVGAAVASTIAYTAGGVAIIVIFVRTTRVRTRALVPAGSDLRALLAQLRRVVGGPAAGAAPE